MSAVAALSLSAFGSPTQPPKRHTRSLVLFGRFLSLVCGVKVSPAAVGDRSSFSGFQSLGLGCHHISAPRYNSLLFWSWFHLAASIESPVPNFPLESQPFTLFLRQGRLKEEDFFLYSFPLQTNKTTTRASPPPSPLSPKSSETIGFECSALLTLLVPFRKLPHPELDRLLFPPPLYP